MSLSKPRSSLSVDGVDKASFRDVNQADKSQSAENQLLLDFSSTFKADAVANNAAEELQHSRPRSQDVAHTETKKNHLPLFLCLYFPSLSLDLVNKVEDQSLVIIEDVSGRYKVHSVCKNAEAQGITAHMDLTAAYALCSDVVTQQRDVAQETEQLKDIANWAQQFTPRISILEPYSVILEIRASLNLFGGLSALQQRLINEYKKNWAYRMKVAVAPTPLASQILARFSTVNNTLLIEDGAALRSVLGQFSIKTLLLSDDKTLNKLKNIGVNNLQDLWRLPRESLARRFGQKLTQHLDKLLGMQADPQRIYKPPVIFESSMELPYAASNNKTVVIAVAKLVQGLEDFLREHDAGVAKIYLHLIHFDKTSHDLTVGLRQCSRDASHIIALFREHLERLKTFSAVCEVKIRVDEVIPFIAHAQSIFPQRLFAASVSDNKNPQVVADWHNLLEQLQNRFGPQVVQHIQVVDEHRPELSWCYTSVWQASSRFGAQEKTLLRPLWLLQKPRYLKMKQSPCYRGLLKAVHGPERIESGWWEDDNIHRDYYIARDCDHSLLWIYRDLINKQWFLHGLFG